MAKFYISDLHLGHAKILKFDNRPFLTLDEMHRTIRDNWNDVITDNDEVYILGDAAWRNDVGAEILRTLAGKKYLIIGNHDRLNRELTSIFEWCKEYAEIKDNGNKIVLCHYPIAHWKNADYGTIHLYGHIHNGRNCRPFSEYVYSMINNGWNYECYNVGCMMPYMNYTPKTLAQIRKSFSGYLRRTRMEGYINSTIPQGGK